MKRTLNLFILYVLTISNVYALDCEHGRKVVGTVNDVFVGEVDENVLGDVCITFFATNNSFPDGSSLLGVVENHLDCSLADKYLDNIGSKVETCLTNLSLIDSGKAIKVLKSFHSDTFYLMDTAN